MPLNASNDFADRTKVIWASLRIQFGGIKTEICVGLLPFVRVHLTVYHPKDVRSPVQWHYLRTTPKRATTKVC